MNPPEVYMCSPSWTLLPPPSPFHPPGSSQCTSPKHPVSCIKSGLATHLIHDILHVSIPFIFTALYLYLKFNAAAAAAKLLQSCPTLCDPRDGSPPGYPVPGILQARTLEWVAFSFSNAWKWKVKVKSFSRVRLLATPWTAAYQAPPSMGFSRQEYWSGLPLLSPEI